MDVIVLHATAYEALGLTHLDVTAQIEVGGTRSWVNCYSGDWPADEREDSQLRWMLRVMESGLAAARRRAQSVTPHG